MGIPLTPPTIVLKNTIEFKFPYDSPYSLELTLSRPQSQDDIWRVSLNRSMNELLNKELKIYRNSGWPKSQRLLFTMVEVPKTLLDEVRIFKTTTLGKPIKYIDWYTQTWEAIILNSNDEQTEDVDNNTCGPFYTLNFELLAELKSWP